MLLYQVRVWSCRLLVLLVNQNVGHLLTCCQSSQLAATSIPLSCIMSWHSSLSTCVGWYGANQTQLFDNRPRHTASHFSTFSYIECWCIWKLVTSAFRRDGCPAYIWALGVCSLHTLLAAGVAAPWCKSCADQPGTCSDSHDEGAYGSQQVIYPRGHCPSSHAGFDPLTSKRC